jgi:hypothetical protein
MPSIRIPIENCNPDYDFWIEDVSETEGTEKWVIVCVARKPTGYYHCAYSHQHDARIVAERIASDLQEIGYRVNFGREPPLRVRDNLDR